MNNIEKELIVNDILNIDDSKFDAAYYNAYLHFKALDEANYIKYMDMVTSYLSSTLDSNTKRFTSARLKDVNSFQGYLDKNGFSSIKAFENYSEKVLCNYAEYLNQQQEVAVPSR